MKLLCLLTLLAASSLVTEARPLFLSRAAAVKNVEQIKKHDVPAVATKQNMMKVVGIPRGGAGPLNAEKLVKVTTFLAILQGFFMHAAPDKAMKPYGVQGDDMTHYFTQQMGTGLLTYGIELYVMLFNKASYTTALKLGYLGFLYNNLRILLSDGWKSIVAKGDKPTGLYIASAIQAFMLYALTQDYTKKAALVATAFWAINAVVLILDPKTGLELWKGDTSKLSNVSRASIKAFGFYLLAVCALFYSLISLGDGAVKAAGYGSVVWALFHAWTLVDKDFTANKQGMIIWMVMHLVIAGTTLL